MASYGSVTSCLLIFSARDDLVKVSWNSDAGKCQNQPTPPYFDQLSERYQPLWEEIIQNEVSLGGSSTIKVTLTTAYHHPEKIPLELPCLLGREQTPFCFPDLPHFSDLPLEITTSQKFFLSKSVSTLTEVHFAGMPKGATTELGGQLKLQSKR